jgi:hypothetical protein
LPLSDRARVEVYLPDLASPAYQELSERLVQEFTYTFGGCTLVRGIGGNYLSLLGFPIEDRINLLYTDTPFTFDAGFEQISLYADALRQAAFEALEEEAILITVYKVYHSVNRQTIG